MLKEIPYLLINPKKFNATKKKVIVDNRKKKEKEIPYLLRTK